MIERHEKKLIVILGPTASGKTRLAVELARKFDGEIVSADSRQVYRGMDVGTGKDLDEYGEVKYHLIDVADPKDSFSLAQYKKMAEGAIDDIIGRGKVPFLVGGSGLYLQAVVDNYGLSEIGENKELRQALEDLDAGALLERLRGISPSFAARVNQSDSKNKRRLIRYIELQSSGGKPDFKNAQAEKYRSLVLGLYPGKEAIDGNIHKRLIDRLENEDMVSEVDRLHAQGVSWDRLRDFGLEYRFVSEYLQERTDYDTMVERLDAATRQFAKKQMTWFRRWEKQGRGIDWLEGDLSAEASRLISRFLPDSGN